MGGSVECRFNGWGSRCGRCSNSNKLCTFICDPVLSAASVEQTQLLSRLHLPGELIGDLVLFFCAT